MKRLISALVMVMTIATVSHAQEGLKAHDINGYALGMTYAQINARAGKTCVIYWRNACKLTIGGDVYDFTFTALNRVYMIDYTHPLGRFVPDRTFTLALAKKLTDKYGPTDISQLPDVAQWAYTERYDNGGPGSPQILNRFTERASFTLLHPYQGPVTEDMWIQSFALDRQDAYTANKHSRSQAESKLKF